MKDFRYFILQYNVRKLYRDLMKTVYKSKNVEARNELIDHIKREFVANKGVEKPEKIEYLISVGRQQHTSIKSMIDMIS